jgi:hypothetical protein
MFRFILRIGLLLQTISQNYYFCDQFYRQVKYKENLGSKTCKGTILIHRFVRLSLVVVLMIISTLNASSQLKEIVEITGKIVSMKDNSPIHFASVMNLNKGTGYTCDSLGYFHVTMHRDDILIINALGYERKYFSLKDSVLNTSEIFIIKLDEKTYHIAGVDIYDARWKDFEFEFSKVEIEKQETKDRIQKWFYTLIDPKELALITASTAIGIPIHFKSNQDKQNIKLEEIKIIDAENKIIYSKYNPELVAEITGFNESETYRFMKFCNFDRGFLLKSNDYDIITEIKKQHERYFKIIHR